jgi:hypothetical protein
MAATTSRKATATDGEKPAPAPGGLEYYPVKTPFGRRAIVPLGPKIIENLVVTSIGHAFGQIPPVVPGPKLYFVQDFLVDQSQSTGGGAMMQDPLQFDLSAAYGYRYNVTAPSGMKFQVKAPPGAEQLSFSAYLGRAWLNMGSGIFDASAGLTQFVLATGPNPVLTYNTFFITHGNNQALTFEVEASWQDFSFSAFATEQTFSPRTQDPGAKWYKPLSYALPLGITSAPPGSETFVLFQCVLTTPVDPGRFVTLVPLSPDVRG